MVARKLNGNDAGAWEPERIRHFKRLEYSLEEQLTLPSENNQHVYDYTLQNFTSIQINKYGHLKNKLIAKTMVHFPDTNTELTAPYIEFYKREEQDDVTVVGVLS